MTRWTIRRVEVPSPYTVGPVNCYLLRGDALVMIDPGPLTRAGLQILRDALRGWGARLRDVDAILLTHAHLDHFGMGGLLRDRTGARVYAHAEDRAFMENFPQSHYRLVERLREHSLAHGFPAEEFRRIACLYLSSLECGRPIAVDHYVRGGEALEFGGCRLSVIHTPGHTAGSVCYLDRASCTLFSGDTVLNGQTPIAFFRGHAPHAAIGVSIYLNSLRRLRRLRIEQAMPGHRRPFRGFRRAVRAIERQVDRYGRAILRCLTAGPRTAWEMARELFPSVRGANRWLAFAKTLGVVEHLQERGAIRSRRDSDGTWKHALKTTRFVVSAREP